MHGRTAGPGPDRWREDSDNSKDAANDPLDAAMGRIAARQGGRITTAQLRDLGLLPSAITYRVKLGRLIKEHREVYRVGYKAPGREGRWRGALLGVPESALGYWDASSVHELWFSDHPKIHLVVAGYGGRN